MFDLNVYLFVVNTNCSFTCHVFCCIIEQLLRNYCTFCILTFVHSFFFHSTIDFSLFFCSSFLQQFNFSTMSSTSLSSSYIKQPQGVATNYKQRLAQNRRQETDQVQGNTTQQRRLMENTHKSKEQYTTQNTTTIQIVKDSGLKDSTYTTLQKPIRNIATQKKSTNANMIERMYSLTHCK